MAWASGRKREAPKDDVPPEPADAAEPAEPVEPVEAAVLPSGAAAEAPPVPAVPAVPAVEVGWSRVEHGGTMAMTCYDWSWAEFWPFL